MNQKTRHHELFYACKIADTKTHDKMNCFILVNNHEPEDMISSIVLYIQNTMNQKSRRHELLYTCKIPWTWTHDIMNYFIQVNYH